MMRSTTISYKNHRFSPQIIARAVWLWSVLPQFSCTKLVIAVDGDIDVKSWPDVIWALSTRFDASRDLVVIDNTPIDYLDFASPKSGLGGKLGLDATNKIGAETDREWGRPSPCRARSSHASTALADARPRGDDGRRKMKEVGLLSGSNQRSRP